MGTRADFYVRNEKKEPQMEWLGSIAWDGYEIGDIDISESEKEFRSRLSIFLENRDDATYPQDGWPWPWNNSKLTDEIWVWNCEDNSIYRGFDHDGEYEDATTPQYFSKGTNQFGYDENGDEIENIDRSVLKAWLLPDMSQFKNVKLGKGSGIIAVSFSPNGSIDVA